MTTALRICPLCEATCGLTLTLDETPTDGERGAQTPRVTEVRGDPDDVFSAGYLCPKGVALAELHDDPDRLRLPLVRGSDGELAEASWDEAFARVEQLLAPLLDGQRERIALYLGNPNVHTLAGQLLNPALSKAVGTRHLFTASTMDQMPKHVSAGLMFGDKLSIPVPDIDRTDFLLCLGADPLTSNGSLWTAPDLPGRIRALLDRGGHLVVVDPRRSTTAAKASQHVAIRPGTDPLLLAAIAWTLFDEGLVDLGGLQDLTEGLDDLARLVTPFTPERVAAPTGVDADTIRELTRGLAAARRACVYSRIGTHTARFGTLASWLVDALNILTGNLDRPGGAMFPLAPAGQRNATASGPGRELAFGRWHSVVSGHEEVFGELPVACLAEELEADDGPRALLTIAGNPALSAPDAGRLEHALAGLDAMISVDCYANETTRHADVVLPAPSPLYAGHYDFAFTQLACRNTARWSPPALELPPDQRSEWEIMLRLIGIAAGQGADADPNAVEDFIAYQVAAQQVQAPGSRVADRDPAALLAETAPRRGPERILDLLLRTGPYDLTLADLEAAAHGIDLGPLEPRMPEILRTPSERIELVPARIAADVPRLEGELDTPRNGLVLIGRRHLRSNNSWMHNLPSLVSGTNRCTLHVHPDDAAALGLGDGGQATVTSGSGKVEVDVEVTDRIAPGVVSLPHGWGHGREGAQLAVAAEHAGVNTNLLTDPAAIDPLSGNAVLNAIPVQVSPAG